jgi:hypothetical protein
MWLLPLPDHSTLAAAVHVASHIVAGESGATSRTMERECSKKEFYDLLPLDHDFTILEDV